MKKKEYIQHQGCSGMFFCIYAEFVGMGFSLNAKRQTGFVFKLLLSNLGE